MSFNHTIGDLTDGLLVFGIFISSQAVTLDSVVWDVGGTNQSMSILTVQDANTERFYLGYLANPTDNGTYQVTFTLSGSATLRPLVASYQGCRQTGIPDNSNFASTASNTTLTSTLTTVADNCWHVGFGRENANGSTGAGASTTQRTGAATSVGWFDNNAAITPAGSNGIIFTTTPAAAMAFYTMSIAPPSTTAIKTVDGLAKASVKTVNGLAIASVKTINGLA